MRAVLRPREEQERAGEQRDQHGEEEDGWYVQIHAPVGVWSSTALLLSGRNEARDVDDFQLETIRVVEEHRVVPRDVRVFLWFALELGSLRA